MNSRWAHPFYYLSFLKFITNVVASPPQSILAPIIINIMAWVVIYTTSLSLASKVLCHGLFDIIIEPIIAIATTNHPYRVTEVKS